MKQIFILIIFLSALSCHKKKEKLFAGTYQGTLERTNLHLSAEGDTLSFDEAVTEGFKVDLIRDGKTCIIRENYTVLLKELEAGQTYDLQYSEGGNEFRMEFKPADGEIAYDEILNFDTGESGTLINYFTFFGIKQ